MGNERQIIAKKDRKYEFYTRRVDIEDELSHYAHHFKGKVVYCNCDDPAESEFWKFFQRNFKEWGLKKLIATHYEPDEQNYSYVLTLNEGSDWKDEPIKTPIPCNGDFRSATCIELLKQADIVVTNPPFGLFREYIDQLMEYGKKFLVMGSMEAITYKNVFPLLMENKIWVGYGFNKTMAFRVPDGYRYDVKMTEKINDGWHYGKVPEITWFTNLDIPKRHELLDLRGNYYSPDKYPFYDNYDAIEIGKWSIEGVKWVGDLSSIPIDYDAVMGVPITFMGCYNPAQFEILGITLGNTVDYPMTKLYEGAKQHCKDGSIKSGSKVNTRASLKVFNEPVGVVYYTADNSDGYLLSLYPRILIKRK